MRRRERSWYLGFNTLHMFVFLVITSFIFSQFIWLELLLSVIVWTQSYGGVVQARPMCSKLNQPFSRQIRTSFLIWRADKARNQSSAKTQYNIIFIRSAVLHSHNKTDCDCWTDTAWRIRSDVFMDFNRIRGHIHKASKRRSGLLGVSLLYG